MAQLQQALYLSWGKDTATNGDWDENNRSKNQCAVTALVVQDYFGGDLMRCEMTDGDSHYWNNIPELGHQDLTSDQFLHIEASPIRSTQIVRSREYVLSFPDTHKRYKLLSERVKKYIEGSE